MYTNLFIKCNEIISRAVAHLYVLPVPFVVCIQNEKKNYKYFDFSCKVSKYWGSSSSSFLSKSKSYVLSRENICNHVF